MKKIITAGIAILLTLASSTPVSSAVSSAVPASLTKGGITSDTTLSPVVQRSLAALAKLKQLGYSWTTDAGALKAIKHWQKVNGLVVDGVVGPQTLASLGLGASVTVPAVRLNPPAPRPEPEGDVESIIRDVWPDDLEDWAVRIATRESKLQPHVRNSCCWGLFQIHWQAHHTWLIAEFGITSPEQLYDPVTNATVALALYMRSNPHCQPWGC